jgi:hypothetical protein
MVKEHRLLVLLSFGNLGSGSTLRQEQTSAIRCCQWIALAAGGLVEEVLEYSEENQQCSNTIAGTNDQYYKFTKFNVGECARNLSAIPVLTRWKSWN